MLTSPRYSTGNPLRSSQERSVDGSQSRPRPTRSSSRRGIWASHRKYYTRLTWLPYAPTLAFAMKLVNLSHRFSNPTCQIASPESSSSPIPLTKPLSIPARSSSKAMLLTLTGSSTSPPACYHVGSAPRNRFFGTIGGGSCVLSTRTLPLPAQTTSQKRFLQTLLKLSSLALPQPATYTLGITMHGLTGVFVLKRLLLH